MTDSRDPQVQVLLGLLRLMQAAKGYEFCDRCCEPLYDEVMRCDFCCGQFGIPTQEQIKKWLDDHPGYLERIQRERDQEMEEDRRRQEEEDADREADEVDDPCTESR